MWRSSLKKFFLSALAAVALYPPPAEARGGVVFFTPKRNLYIFTVGIDDYSLSKGQLVNLRFSKKDAVTLADEFERRGQGLFVKVKRVTLLDQQARRDAILATLDSLTQEIGSDDVFIFAFAGMGGTHFSKGEFSLVPYDFNVEAKEQTLIPVGRLQSYFRKIRARSKLIVLDSCESSVGYEQATQAFIEQDPNVKRILKDDFLMVGTDTLSYEIEEVGHGSVTSVLLNGLRGKADFDDNGVVTSAELEAYAYCGGIQYSARYANGNFHIQTASRGRFTVGHADKGLREMEARRRREAERGGTRADAGRTRAGLAGAASPPGEPSRDGDDYALLFANQNYDNPGWPTLKNPRNDVEAIAAELRTRYGFKETVIKRDLTTQEIYDAIEEYQKREARRPDDQLFIFFAGHGVADTYNKGFYVGKDSPHPLKRANEGQFVSLDGVLNAVDRIKISHIMVVFDACYAGQVWQPSVQLIQEVAAGPRGLQPFARLSRPPALRPGASFVNAVYEVGPQAELPTGVYAKRKMKNRARVILTSGDKPVFDSWRRPDGTLSSHSPFADAFLGALRTGGGEDNVLITSEIIPFIDKLTPEPQKGRLSNSDGDFVFVHSGRSNFER